MNTFSFVSCKFTLELARQSNRKGVCVGPISLIIINDQRTQRPNHSQRVIAHVLSLLVGRCSNECLLMKLTDRTVSFSEINGFVRFRTNVNFWILAEILIL